MSDVNLQITARGPRAEAEAAAAAIDADPRLEACAYSILEEDEARNVWRLDIYPTSDDEAEAFVGLLTAWGALQVVSLPLADADWLALALSGLPPVKAGRFFVFGAHDRGRIPANSVGLRIEAVAYDALLKRRRFSRVLDVGTGTGVLAIAAARTGSRRAIGTDIDGVSVRIARENARLNQARASFVRADGLAHRLVAGAAPYDMVFANILAPRWCGWRRISAAR
jgi:ribosomal protein L11 methyltransferase